MTQFGDLTTQKGLTALNEYLAGRSYIEGYVPSQADMAILTSLKCEPCQYAHSARWYRHIKSYTPEEQKCFVIASTVPKNIKVESDDDDDDDDDDFDIFDDEEVEETEEQKRIKEERVAAYAEKKSKKAPIIAKSSVLLDVKPWDDETDMAKMEELVRSIEFDGLVWGQSKLVPLAFGIKKLQISAVIEDDKISTDLLDEEITGFSDYVQSMDIAAFNKI